MRLIRCLCIILLFLLPSSQLLAQIDSIWQQKPEISLSGYADVFYVYDFNKPQNVKRQTFLYNHNRHNEFNVNLGFIKLGINHKKYRSNLALQTGTYAIDNYAAEPDLLKNIFEANIGISLNKKNNLWLDAGVLPSYIGFESAITIDNLTMTRSLLAENSPYFITGVKLTFQPNEKIEIGGLITNGWQRIQRLQGNSIPSFGTQIKYKPSENVSLNWSTFLGTDDPDSTRRMRYFNNFYGQFILSKKFVLIGGFDIGTQQIEKRSSNYNLWFSPVIIGQYSINNTLKTAIRAEYYEDKAGVLIQTETINGFRTTGLSLNLDYIPSQNIMCRIEGRLLNSVDNIFQTSNKATNSNFIIGTTIAIKFSEILKK